MDEWGLQALVRGSSDDQLAGSAYTEDCFSCFSSLDVHFDQELMSFFPDIFRSSSNELDELYKPFLPEPKSSTLSPQTYPSPVYGKDVAIEAAGEMEDEKPFSGSHLVPVPSYSVKQRTRKNQQKKVTVKVTAEGLGADLWAWRKYGQKPIKGSPYPRSYYRCSSSKGCLARRQVEQSIDEPEKYLVTYTAEHNHPRPTRRNSLAGVSRPKFRSPKSPALGGDKLSDSRARFPTTALVSHVEGEVFEQALKKQRRNECNELGNGVAVPDFVLGDGFFSGLEELEGLVFDPSSSCSCSYSDEFGAPFCS